jgi:phage shock protein E
MFRKSVLLATLFGSSLMLLTAAARSEDNLDVDPIPQQILLDYLGGKANFTLIDARSAEEYAAGHIWGALHVAHDADLAANTVLPADRTAPLVVYCKSGMRAEALQASLLAAGYTDVRVLDPAQMLWADELPVFNCGATAPGVNTELVTKDSLNTTGGTRP